METEQQQYSYGTTAIYNQLYKLLVDKNDVDTILINLYTLIRNAVHHYAPDELKLVKSGDRSLQEVIEILRQRVVKEVEQFFYDTAHMLNRPSPVSLTIFSYRYDYSNIVPAKFLRHKNDQILNDILDCVESSNFHKETTHGTFERVALCDSYLEKGNIVEALIKQVGMIPNQHNVLHISHHPIDYHIAPYCNSWRLIKSYTGAVWSYDMLGRQILQLDLPYMKQLHILLGDKTDLKSVLTPKQKEKLLSVAKEESWYLLPEDKIQERLRQLTFLTPYTF